MRDIRSGVADVAVHLPHDANVLVAVQQCVFLFLDDARSARSRGSRRAVRACFECLQAGVAQHDNQTARVFVLCRDGNVLRCDKLRQCWRRERPGSFRGLKLYVRKAVTSASGIETTATVIRTGGELVVMGGGGSEGGIQRSDKVLIRAGEGVQERHVECLPGSGVEDPSPAREGEGEKGSVCRCDDRVWLKEDNDNDDDYDKTVLD